MTKKNKEVGMTIERQLHMLIMSAAFLCICVVLVSCISIWGGLSMIHTFFRSNSALESFYRNVDEMDIAAREWVYSQSQENYNAYLKSADAARFDLREIYNNGDRKLTWQFGRLENMVDHYQIRVDNYIKRKDNINITYQDLRYQCSLIRNTALTYYGHMADYIKISSNRLQSRWNNLLYIQIAAFFAFITAAIVVSSRVSGNILRPIQTMIENSRLIQQGKFDLLPVEKAPAELSIMAEAFAQMSEKVKQNIETFKENARLQQKLLEWESERLVIENLVTRSELHFLQAQINPHFLFNTLSMIYKSAYLSKDAVTGELIDRLSRFLRYALDKGSTTSTLFEEISATENYLFIQKKRFGDRVRFILDVPENVPDLEMPAIVLQPLVENSIKHGFSAGAEPLVISLKVRYRNGCIRIVIEDDGVGMPTEKLENLQSCLKLGSESVSGIPGAGIGLTNVYRRLKLHFGSDMQFNIESEENCGTLITISLSGGEES